MESSLDAKRLVYLPLWARIFCIVTLGVGLLLSSAVVIGYFGSSDNRDWVLIGLTSAQFLITTLVIAVVLFVSQTDATIGNLTKRTQQFLSVTLPDTLASISSGDDDVAAYAVVRSQRQDIFGCDYAVTKNGIPVIRLWFGINVSRIIVIYRVIDPSPAHDRDAFLETLKTVFRFTLGGAESVGYKISVEPIANLPGHVSIWLTAPTDADFLTNPMQKLFWAQDVAMMTESMLRTALRHPLEVRLDLRNRPGPQ